MMVVREFALGVSAIDRIWTTAGGGRHFADHCGPNWFAINPAGRDPRAGFAKMARGSTTVASRTIGMFNRYIGIDYSGAADADCEPERACASIMTEGDSAAGRGVAAASPRKYWTRRGIAEWLVERLAEDVPTLVGIDHGFSFPLRYFRGARSPARLARVPRRFPAPLADRRRHLRRFRPRRHGGQRRGAHGQPPLAAVDRGARRREIGVSFRRAGIGR